MLDLGLLPYRQAWTLQRDLHARVAAGEEIDTWLIVEHPPVITLGRNAKREHLLFSPEDLAKHGVDCVEVERGGDVTYHGPGQLVLYPIVRLPRFREIVPLVGALEEAAIATLRSFGISAHGRGEHRGVYVENKAICAIGLAIRKMTSLHGMALNVCTALDYDRLITPCGMPEFGITSIARETHADVPLERAKPPLIQAVAERFQIDFETPQPLLSPTHLLAS